MEKEELIEKIKNGVTESQLSGVEFKKKWGQEHGKDISAIANSEHIPQGWLVIGIEDSGKLAGHDKSWLKTEEQRVSNHIREYLDPSWAADEITPVEINGSSCIFINIKSTQDVVKWNHKAYHLVGTSSVEMKPHEVMELSLRLPGTDFSKAKYSYDFDPALVVSFAQRVSDNSDDFNIDINSTSSSDVLRKLNLIDTNTAGILFGEFHYRVVNFDENGDILDQRKHKGLYRILEDSFIEVLQSRARKKGTHLEGYSISAREDMPYPKKALREILANAVSHSLYQRHQGDIVVETHPNRVTVRNNCTLESKAFVDKWFSRTNRSNNKHLMNALRLAGITDEQGTGKLRVFRLMLENGKRAPIIDFEEFSDYGRWSITLYNSDSNAELKALSEEMKTNFSDQEQWRLATALVLWRDRSWSEIETFLDEHYKYVAYEVFKNINAPVIYHDNKLLLKRWAYVRLTGQVTKSFTEGEKAFLYKFLSNFSFTSGQDGNITSIKARELLGLSDTKAEQVQLGRLFTEWKEQGKMDMVKRGHWKFTESPSESDG